MILDKVCTVEDIQQKFFTRTNGKWIHTCALPAREDMVVTYITTGCCVALRRKLKKYFMINESNAYTKECFTSTLQIEKEKKRHLRFYYYMIHPFSKAKYVFFTKIFQILFNFGFILANISIYLYSSFSSLPFSPFVYN